MSKRLWELRVPVNDEAEHRIDLMHRKWEFSVAVKVRAANCCTKFYVLCVRARARVCVCVCVSARL